MSNKNLINCPNCNHEFAVDEALSLRAEEKLKEEYKSKLNEQLSTLKAEKTKLEQDRANYDSVRRKDKEKYQQELVKRFNEQRQKDKADLDKERQEILKSVRETVKSDYENQLKANQEELEAKSKALRALKEKEIAMERLKRQMSEDQKNMEIEFEKRIKKERDEYEKVIIDREKERNDLKMKEYEKKLNDQKKLIEEMQRKAEQGSMQMQGEVLELELENLLEREFPFDEIEEVPKGIRGADVIQTVINAAQKSCGKIVYESKRTKNFGGDWIEKLKADQLKVKADLAVLVTETMPKDMKQFGQISGVWVCSFREVSSLINILRQMLIRVQSVQIAQANMGDKMNLVYNFVTSTEFKHRVEAIVEGFQGMQDSLNREKRAMQKIWKERETQIDKVVNNTIDMYASIKGLAGNSIQNIPSLELDGGDSELLEL